MNSFKRIRRILFSFHYAIQGIIYAVKTERNMKIHFVCGSLACMLALLLQVPKLELLLVLLAIFFVLTMEMINTAIEATVDLVTQDAHPLAKIAKDVAAGAVMLAVVLAVIIGFFVFIPAILELLTS